MHRPLLLAVALLGSSPAQSDPLPHPETFLGYPLGERFTRHCDIVSYARLAADSDRVSLVEYGQTPERRPLIYLVVTAPENHQNMEALRARHGRLADPRLEDPDTVEPIDAEPVVIWLSYNVHGNEPSPSEAALRVLHRLTTADDEETRLWLKESIILIDPCINPDGRDRYANWYNGLQGRRADPEPQAMEHAEPWPGGRFNHWLFDLNRDWAFVTQPETRARHPQMIQWAPQVHVDFHEMGYDSSYFFFPAEKPINSNLPDHTLKWGRRFGKGNAAAFDREGWSYYTAESFDLFYPGYGDSWPSFTGAIGMTYEQGGHSRAGSAVRRNDGSILTLRERLHHHEVASYATIQTAVAGRRELLADYREFRRSAIEEGRTGPVRAFLLPPGTDPGRADALVDTLLVQGIEVRRTTEAFTAPRTRDSLGHDVLDRTFEPGTYVIDLSQPQKRLAKTLLEARTEIRELYFYDISAWSLPLAYGIPAFECPSSVTVTTEPVTEWPKRPGGLAAGPTTVAWLLPYQTRSGLLALTDLLREGVRVRSAREAFTLDGQAFARGTLVIRTQENEPELPTVLERVGQARGVFFQPASSGFTEDGIDLGSSSVVPVVPPRIALIGGSGVSSTGFGATRFLIDQVFDLPYSVLSREGLQGMDLSRFTTVVVPECSLDADHRTALSQFANSGGVVVAFGRAAFSLCEEGGARIQRASSPEPAEKAPEPKWTEQRDEHRRAEQQPGSVFRVELDPAHPLSFGYRTEIAAFKEGTQAFDPTGPGTHVGLFVVADAVSGYVPKSAQAALQGKAFVSVERRGDGALVLFADDPNFRGTWRGLARLFLNGVLLLPSKHVPQAR